MFHDKVTFCVFLLQRALLMMYCVINIRSQTGRNGTPVWWLTCHITRGCRCNSTASISYLLDGNHFVCFTFRIEESIGLHSLSQIDRCDWQLTQCSKEKHQYLTIRFFPFDDLSSHQHLHTKLKFIKIVTQFKFKNIMNQSTLKKISAVETFTWKFDFGMSVKHLLFCARIILQSPWFYGWIIWSEKLIYFSHTDFPNLNTLTADMPILSCWCVNENSIRKCLIFVMCAFLISRSHKSQIIKYKSNESKINILLISFVIEINKILFMTLHCVKQ